MSDLQVFLCSNNIVRSLSAFFSNSLKICSYLFLLTLVSLPSLLFAEETTVVKVDYANKTYRTELSTTIHATPDALFKLLTSYGKLSTLSQTIHKSQLLANGHLLLDLKVCFTIICFEKQQTLELTVNKHTVTARIIREQSDFESGWMQWRLTPGKEDGNTLFYFSSEMIPDFWVPPLIGPLLIQHKLKKEARYSIRQLDNSTQTIKIDKT